MDNKEIADKLERQIDLLELNWSRYSTANRILADPSMDASWEQERHNKKRAKVGIEDAGEELQDLVTVIRFAKSLVGND